MGAGAEAVALASELDRDQGVPFECVGLVRVDPDDIRVDLDDQSGHTASENGHAAGRIENLASTIAETKPDFVVFEDGPTQPFAVDRFLDAAQTDVRVGGLHHFYERAFGRVPVEGLSPSWFMTVFHLYHRPYSRVTKRIFDLTVGCVALVLLAPMLLVTAVLVRLSSPGPILFTQTRLGERGKTYKMRKFRTMVDRAEEPGSATWTAEEDPRITTVGRFLRRTRLDELPQFWNVLRGEMSIVGPRPERPEFVDVLERDVPFWTHRHLVKPGITGWAQLRHGYTASVQATADKLSFDLFYVKHRSLLFDCAILLKTVEVVVLGRGAR